VTPKLLRLTVRHHSLFDAKDTQQVLYVFLSYEVTRRVSYTGYRPTSVVFGNTECACYTSRFHVSLRKRPQTRNIIATLLQHYVPGQQ